MDLLFWAPVMLAGLVAGASTGLLGGYIVGMRIPFLGICVAHAALAGAVFGALGGLTGPALLLPALAAAAVSAILVGLIDPQTVRVDINVVLSILFSLMMGLAFLGLGMFSLFGVSDNEVRNLLWGSLTFCRWRDLWIMVAVMGVEWVLCGRILQGDARDPVFARPCRSGRRPCDLGLDAVSAVGQPGADGQFPDGWRLDDLQPVGQPRRGGSATCARLRPDVAGFGHSGCRQRIGRLPHLGGNRSANRCDDRDSVIPAGGDLGRGGRGATSIRQSPWAVAMTSSPL